MKRLMLGVVLALLFVSGQAFGAAFADNDQLQTQFDGGFAGAGGGAAGFIGGAGASQDQGGFVISDTPGDQATEGQFQQQIQADGVSASDGVGNFSGTAWLTYQEQTGGSATAGGFAAQGQSQDMVGGAAGLTVGGQFGVAGSAGFAFAEAGSLALGASVAGNEQTQVFAGAYAQQSVGPNGGYVYQEGQQTFGTSTATGALIIGAAGAQAGVIQAGGTLAVNNGVGTAMAGSGTAAGDAYATTGAAGIAGAEASAFGTQTHSYEQYNQSADGTSQQFAQGTVSTSVQATSVSVGP